MNVNFDVDLYEVMKDSTVRAFFTLVQAGLWEKDVCLSQFGEVDYGRILELAQEQSVVGLVAAGLEHVIDVKLPKEDVLQFVGQALLLEQQNRSMNAFLSRLVEQMRREGIYTLLVKGQAIAQRYERPLWRASGDVDLFLSEDNYEKAKTYLVPLATSVEPEGRYGQHLGMTLEGNVVELHGNLRCGLSSRVDKVLDGVRNDTFYSGNVSSWSNAGVQTFLLSKENEVFYVFTHILSHFYKGGIGLRQICDWTRLLWTYRDTMNQSALELLINKAGLMTEWRAFGVFAVEYLGLMKDAVPYYSEETKWGKKAARIQSFIMAVGNFGHNRDMSYYSTKPYFVRKTMSLGRRAGDLMNHFCIFPIDTLRFTPRIVINGLKSAANGE